VTDVHVGGRPRIIESSDEFDRLVDEFVANCKAEGEPVTITGLALHLGFSCRQSMYQYKKHDGFYDSVKRACTLVELEYEKGLARGAGAGHIFALKNFNWTDRQEISGPGGGPIETKTAVVDADALSDVADKL
jgi:hypothetical protein